MCDCYTDKCKVCGEPVDMHLEDFETSQDEIEVYCGLHMPDDRTDGVVWKYGDAVADKKVFVRWLTKNAKEHADGNHPNSYVLECMGKPDGCLAVMESKDFSGMVPEDNRRS